MANAIGAITSSVCVTKQVTISPAGHGGYAVEGLPQTPRFADFEEAHNYSIRELLAAVRRRASASGTSQSRVEVLVRDRVATIADGSQLFVGRTLGARLTGRPDVSRLG